MHLLQLTGTIALTREGHYLQGPRTPQKVRRDGYGFTPDPAAAWPFPSVKQAEHKARIVTRHIGWTRPPFKVVDSSSLKTEN